MARHRPLPKEPATATVERFTHDGRGLAYADGKAVFIEQALPGETVRFRYTDRRRDYACGTVLEVLTPAPERILPPCPYFGVCGGCRLQHLEPTAQLACKQNLLLEQLRRIGKVEPLAIWPPLTGPLLGYRRKARLGVRRVPSKDRVLVGFREQGTGRIADIHACLVLHPNVGTKIQELAALINDLSVREQIPQVEVAIGDNRSALVLRVLGPAQASDLAALQGFGQAQEFDIYLQPQGPDSLLALLPEAPSLLCYSLPEEITLWFGPLEFTQINAEINRRMIEQVLTVLDPHPSETVLDLFCGLGNFTLPLARRAARVVGVDGNPKAIARARENAKVNQISNAEFYCADLNQDLTGFSWAQARYDKLLLDPSRAGALEAISYVSRWRPEQIVYVSCNPATLARDIGYLVHTGGYRLVGVGIMDMFPHTAHVESMAQLVAR